MSAEGNDFIEGETSKERESNTSNPVEPYVLNIVVFVVAVAAIVAATSWLMNMPFGIGVRQVVLNISLACCCHCQC